MLRALLFYPDLHMPRHDDFYLQIAHALSGCQLVEQELKLYISEALELAGKYIDGRMPFNMRGNDYEDSSLEKLIDTFRKLNDNPKLLTDLRNFKKERNFLSHKGIAHCIDWQGELSDSAVTAFKARLPMLQFEADRLQDAIRSDAARLLGDLYKA